MIFKLGRMAAVWLGLAVLAAAQVRDTSYPDSPAGLQLQAQQALQAFFSGDRREFEASTRRFALPEPELWLGRAFGPQRGDAMAADYRKYFKAFQSGLARQLERWRDADEPSLQLWPVPEPPAGERVMPRPDAPTPREPVNVQRFRFVLRGRGTRSPAQWVDSFVYSQGAFRFIGPGAFPFWDHPLVVRLNSPASVAGRR